MAVDAATVAACLEPLIAELAATQTLPCQAVDVASVQWSMSAADAALAVPNGGAPGVSEELHRRLVAGLCAWLRAHEGLVAAVPAGGLECMAALLRLVARLLGHEPQIDSLAIQKGVLSSVVAILAGGAVDASLAGACIEVLAPLSVSEGSDVILSRLGAEGLLADLLVQYPGDFRLIEDATTALALLAKRTRHRRALTQGGNVVKLVDVLRNGAARPPILVAVCRFFSNFAAKPECCLVVLNTGGLDALIVAFNGLGVSTITSEAADSQAFVASAIWACTTDCPEAQAHLFAVGWLATLANALRASPGKVALQEAGLGIVRGLSGHAAYREAVINQGFVAAALQAMRTFGDNTTLLKEACGIIAKLATDPDIRDRLGEMGAPREVLVALARCRGQKDRKCAKLALGALSNLASSEANREAFAGLQPAPVLLESARIFMSTENVLEHAVGAISHLAAHPSCNRQLVEAGAVEALLLFLGVHGEDRDVVAKALVALHRLLRFSAGGTNGQDNIALLKQIALAGRPEGNRGVGLLVDAMQAHLYDSIVVREVTSLLTSLSRCQTVPQELLMEVAGPSCMKAMEVHQSEAAVADALAGLLARLPLEEDEQWSHGQALGSSPLAIGPQVVGTALR